MPWLVSVRHLCDLQGLFSEIDNLHTVNRIEIQLMSTWHHDVVTSHGNTNMKKDVTDTSNIWLTVYLKMHLKIIVSWCLVPLYVRYTDLDGNYQQGNTKFCTSCFQMTELSSPCIVLNVTQIKYLVNNVFFLYSRPVLAIIGVVPQCAEKTSPSVDTLHYEHLHYIVCVFCLIVLTTSCRHDIVVTVGNHCISGTSGFVSAVCLEVDDSHSTDKRTHKRNHYIDLLHSSTIV